MKLLIDIALPPQSAAWLRSLGHDAVHASELPAQWSLDDESMRGAAAEGRVVVTAGIDFSLLLEIWGKTRAKFILLRGEDYSESETMEALMQGLAAISREQFAPSVVVVGRRSGGKGVSEA